MSEGPELRAQILDGPSDLEPCPQGLPDHFRLLARHISVVSFGGLVGSLRPSHRTFCTTWLRKGGLKSRGGNRCEDAWVIGYMYHVQGFI